MEGANCKKCKYFDRANWFIRLFFTSKCKYKPIVYTDFLGKQHKRYINCYENKKTCPFH